MSQKNETPVLILSLLITLGVIGGGLWFYNRSQNNSTADNSSVSIDDNSDRVAQTSSSENGGNINSLISSGDRLLLADNASNSKENGIKAIAENNYERAISMLETSLEINRNDPEALIYLNNARIGNGASYTIVASVPISSTPNVAKELLRGVAQAQDEINKNGGIAGQPLKIAIADDNNDADTAQQLAETFADDDSILGVIGHFSSSVTLAAAPTYDENNLVLISPTSTSVELSGASDYVFRTVPSDRYAGNALVRYLLQNLQQRKAAVIYTSESSYSNSLRNVFKTEALSSGGDVVAEYDFSQPGFNVAGIVQKARQEGAEAIVLFPSSAYPNTINNSQAIIQINNGNLSILGGDSLYRPDTLETTGKSSIGIVLAVPWHILSDPDSAFPKNATQLWGADVNWRTALAYDATIALAEAIETNPTRQGIQQALSSDNFNISGASGNIQFLPSGDRDKAVQLVEVQPGSRSGYGVDFVPIR